MSKPICVQEDEDLDAVIAKMTGNGIVRLPVVRENGKLVGVIGRPDILSHMIEPEFVTIVSGSKALVSIARNFPKGTGIGHPESLLLRKKS